MYGNVKTTLATFFKTYSLPIVSGFLIGTTAIPFPPWAVVFCQVPLWYFWVKNETSPKRIFWGGWIVQFIINLIGFHWVANTAIEFGGFPVVLGYVILFLFASVAHLYYPIAGLLWCWLNKKHPHTTPQTQWLIPLIFAICESYYPTIFFWHLGYSWLWANLPGSHLAEWIGFYGLNLVTLVINLFVFYFVLTSKKTWLAAAVVIFALCQVVGWHLKNRFEEGPNTFTTLVVQANIGNAIKVQQDKGAHFHDYILRRFSELTALGLEKTPQAQMILWPETAYPSILRQNDRRDLLQLRLSYSIQSFDRPLLTGAYEQDGRAVYNSMVLFDKDGTFMQSYKKTMLLAFGEYFPGATLYPPLKDWFPMVSDFGRGTGPEVLVLAADFPRLGAQICYESLFDFNSRTLFNKDAQIIVNVTNDSWFGFAFEPYQHLYATLARAIEFRVPLIRSTNTGISAAITAGGEISTFSPRHKEWVGAFTVNYKTLPEPTLYSYYAGFWPEILFSLFLIVVLGGHFARIRIARTKKS